MALKDKCLDQAQRMIAAVNAGELIIAEATIDSLAYRVFEAMKEEGIVDQVEDGHYLLGKRDDDLAVDLNNMLVAFFTARGITVIG